MKFRFFIPLLLLFSFSCGNITTEPSAEEKSIFSTTVPSHLFFKNMRSSYYTSSQQRGTKVDLFQLRKIKMNASSPLIYPVIADNWMEDEAYLLIRTNEYEADFQRPLTVYWSNKEEEGMLKMGSQAGFKEQYAFALELEMMLKQDHVLQVLTEKGERVPVFETYDQKSWFLTTLRDFKKLIEQ